MPRCGSSISQSSAYFGRRDERAAALPRSACLLTSLNIAPLPSIPDCQLRRLIAHISRRFTFQGLIGRHRTKAKPQDGYKFASSWNSLLTHQQLSGISHHWHHPACASVTTFTRVSILTGSECQANVFAMSFFRPHIAMSDQATPRAVDSGFGAIVNRFQSQPCVVPAVQNKGMTIH